VSSLPDCWARATARPQAWGTARGVLIASCGPTALPESPGRARPAGVMRHLLVISWTAPRHRSRRPDNAPGRALRAGREGFSSFLFYLGGGQGYYWGGGGGGVRPGSTRDGKHFLTDAPALPRRRSGSRGYLRAPRTGGCSRCGTDWARRPVRHDGQEHLLHEPDGRVLGRPDGSATFRRPALPIAVLLMAANSAGQHAGSRTMSTVTSARWRSCAAPLPPNRCRRARRRSAGSHAQADRRVQLIGKFIVVCRR